MGAILTNSSRDREPGLVILADSGLLHAREDILRALEKILLSDAFHGSRRSQELLRHLVELALKGENDRLKERILGIEIFHRPADYDTSQDAIVRVSANDVRKRLNQFYAESGDSDFAIRLPAGSYIPEFSVLRPIPAEPTVAEKPPVDAPSPLPPAPAAPPPPAPSAPTRRAQKFQLPLIAFASLCLGIFLSQAFIPLRWSIFHAAAVDREYAIYTDLLGPMATSSAIPTRIVLSDPNTLRYRGSNQPVSTQEMGTYEFPLSEPLATQIGTIADPRWLSFPYRALELNNGEYTGMGEAKTAFDLGGLFQSLGQPAQLTEARFLNWDAARTEHLIVLGGPHMSAWMSSIAAANFVIGYETIHNTKPQPGELAEYPHKRTGPLLDDYGLIWMMQSPSGTRILVLGGITSTGTAGVGSFFADPHSMKPVWEKLRALSADHNIPANWQVLLHIQARDNIPVHVEPVAFRVQ